MILLLCFLLMTASAAAAAWMWVYARQRERGEAVSARLRVGAAVETDRFLGDGQSLNPLLRQVCHRLWRAGIQARADQVRLGLLATAVVAGLMPILFGWFYASIGIGVAALLVAVALSRRIARRRARLVEQLPGYLEAVMRILSAGNNLDEAIGAAARESGEPLRSLFLSVDRQVRLGATVDAVLAEAAQVHGIADLRVLALAVSINRQFGGSLRKVFRSLIRAIRTREAAARELCALTAETRFSAMVLAAIPVLVSAFIALRNRAFYDDMLSTAGGRATLMLAVVLQVAGALLIWRMMRSTRDGAQ